MLSFIHLRTFLTVIKQGSFTRAAHELSLTQPAVSGHIAALEEEFGMPLFNRTGKKIVLTDAGSILQKGARDILDRVEDLKGELTDLKALRGGTIRIGASKIIGVYMLPRILMAFRDQFPDIELQISIHSAHTIAGQVEDNAYDLAIVGEGDQSAARKIGVRVIGEDGEQLGVMSSQEALRLAEEAGVDLVKIAPNAAPPVVKIIDFSRYRYEQRRREKEQKKKQNVIEVKEVRLTPNIDTNDLNTKISAARKFLEKGNKVKVSLRFRGREMSRMGQSKYILDDFAAALAECAQVDKPSKAEGRSLVMILSPKKK